MADIFKPSTEQLETYRAWVTSRPPHVRAVAERFTPWSLYRLKTTGDRVRVVSFGEHDDDRVTLTVHVSGYYNWTLFERQVFGINPDDLEPCELPDEDEIVGVMLEPDEVEAAIPALRAMAGIVPKQ